MEVAGTVLDSETAWQLILQARQQWQPDQTLMTLALDNHQLRISAGGNWECSSAVSPDATSLFDILLPLCAVSSDQLVIAQMGQSLDGLIATPNGVSQYINGPDGLTHLHRLRALVDAVVVGAGTACADNPQLTVRHVDGPSPVRVIIDPNRRVPGHYRLFQDAEAPVLRLVRDGENHSRPGVEDLPLAANENGLAARAILDALAQRGLRRVLIEGGGLTVSRFLQARTLDRLHVLVAPMIIGSGRPAFTLPPMTSLENALRPRTRVFSLGSDSLFDLQPGTASKSP